MAVVAGWALTDFTKKNGATRFDPGSHLTQDFPAYGYIDKNEFIAECPAGSLVIFNAGLWHGSSTKTDPSERSGLFFNYNRWFMRPSFKMHKSMPIEFRDKLTPKMIELSGAYFEEPLDESVRNYRISNEPQW